MLYSLTLHLFRPFPIQVFIFQTIFFRSSPGQRESFPLMTEALTKPLESLRTLTTWIDHIFSNKVNGK